MEREIIEVDVVYVGGGPAALASALHLKNQVKQHNEQVKKEGKGEEIEMPEIAILEKGANLGSHTLSGAVLDMKALNELFPDFSKLSSPPPFEAEVTKDSVYYFTKKGNFLYFSRHLQCTIKVLK